MHFINEFSVLLEPYGFKKHNERNEWRKEQAAIYLEYEGFILELQLYDKKHRPSFTYRFTYNGKDDLIDFVNNWLYSIL